MWFLVLLPISLFVVVFGYLIPISNLKGDTYQMLIDHYALEALHSLPDRDQVRTRLELAAQKFNLSSRDINFGPGQIIWQVGFPLPSAFSAIPGGVDYRYGVRVRRHFMPTLILFNTFRKVGSLDKCPTRFLYEAGQSAYSLYRYLEDSKQNLPAVINMSLSGFNDAYSGSLEHILPSLSQDCISSESPLSESLSPIRNWLEVNGAGGNRLLIIMLTASAPKNSELFALDDFSSELGQLFKQRGVDASLYLIYDAEEPFDDLVESIEPADLAANEEYLNLRLLPIKDVSQDLPAIFYGLGMLATQDRVAY